MRYFILLILSAITISQAVADERPLPPTISHETTLYLNPVDPEGYVDYAAALEIAFGDTGVANRDNAFVGMLENISTDDWPDGHLDEVRQRLRLAPVPDDTQVLIPFHVFLTRSTATTEDAAHELFEKALRGEWADADMLPQVLAWLTAMDAPLDRIRDACRRSNYFVPIVQDPDHPGLVNCLLPQLGSSRMAAKSLMVRARVELSRGEWSQAVDDVVAVVSLSALQTRDWPLISVLVGHANRTLAHGVIRRLLNHPEVGVADIERLRAALAVLPGPMPMSQMIERGERAFLLDSIQQIRRGTNTMRSLLSGRDKPTIDPLTAFVRSEKVDFDQMLRNLKLAWDRAREGGGQVITETMPELIGRVERLAVGGQPRGEDVEHAIEQFARTFVDLLKPATTEALLVDQKIAMQSRLERVGFALVLYEAAHGRFPAALQDLQPAFIQDLPVDDFSGEALIYRHEGSGCVVYSVSGDYDDDHGRDDASADGDLVLRIRR